MITVYRNIKSVYVIDGDWLRAASFVPFSTVVFDEIKHLEKLPLAGLAQAEVSSVIQNKVKQFKVVLTANLCHHFDQRDRHLCVVFETITGDTFLFGMGRSPFPVFNTVDVLPASPQDSSICKLTVEYTHIFALWKLN